MNTLFKGPVYQIIDLTFRGTTSKMKLPIIFFDLETSGLGFNAEVLQIAMRSDYYDFNEYIKPTKPIPPHVSEINKLTFRNGTLYFNNKRLDTLTRRNALKCLLQYLQQFDDPCVLVAHNCPFDSSHLMGIIRKENLVHEFRHCIAGFTDTLAMLRNKFPGRKGKGQLTLTTLAEEISLQTKGAHDADYDVYLLQQVAFHHFSKKDLIRNRKSFDDVLDSYIKAKRTEMKKESLEPMRCFLSESMLKRIASAGISYDMLLDAFLMGGDEEAEDLLKGRFEGIPRVTGNRDTLDCIVSHLATVTSGM